MITIVDYGAGNLKNVEKAFVLLGQNVEITDNYERILKAKTLVLPGVGAFKDAMNKLKSKNLIKPLKDYLRSDRPFLGICLGLQMLFEYSEEGGTNISGLGVLKGSVRKFKVKAGLKIPHMGWNTLEKVRDDSLFSGILDNSYFYYVHSYFLEAMEQDIVIGRSEYGESFDAVIKSGNIYATQFHPEKSGEVGIKLLENFLKQN